MFHRTGISNSNKELERAINERNCDEVKVLLSTGANINHTVNENLDTMLHIAKSAGIACDLLGYSANVNARNLYEKTPLHSAVIDGRSIEIIKTLVLHEADIDVRDSKGNTPLNYAVKNRDRNLDVIQYLVLKGANICAKNHAFEGYDNHCSPLDNAVLLDDLPCIKVLLMYATLKKAWKICSDSSSSVDLHNYFRRPVYRDILRYQHNCNYELQRMRNEKVSDRLTLLHIVVPKFPICDSALKEMKFGIEKCCEILTNNSYPIYNDVIFHKLKNKSDKPTLLKILSTTQIYCELKEQDYDNEDQRIYLNTDSANILAKYLSKEDLFSFIVAFYKPSKQANNAHSINNLIEIRKNLNKRVCEAATSSLYAKYFKLM